MYLHHAWNRHFLPKYGVHELDAVDVASFLWHVEALAYEELVERLFVGDECVELVEGTVHE